MSPARKTNRRANGIATRARILEKAAERFAATGYAGTSLRQVAGAARIDLATLKYHFGDKSTLFGEVYRHGQGNLLAILQPLAKGLATVVSGDMLIDELKAHVGRIHQYFVDNEAFIRMGLFRLLERPAEVIPLQERLEAEIIDLVEQTVDHLKARGILRIADTRAFVVLVVTAPPTWFISARARPGWLDADPDEMPQRFTDFFVDLVSHVVVQSD